MKKSTPMLKLQAAKTVPAAKSVPALKLVPATKVESATDKSAKVRHGGHPTADSRYLLLIQDKNLFHIPVQLYKICLFVFQSVVRVRDSNMCAICEFVMKQLESMLEDQTTEVGYVLLDVSNMAIKIYKTLPMYCWRS